MSASNGWYPLPGMWFIPVSRASPRDWLEYPQVLKCDAFLDYAAVSGERIFLLSAFTFHPADNLAAHFAAKGLST